MSAAYQEILASTLRPASIWLPTTSASVRLDGPAEIAISTSTSALRIPVSTTEHAQANTMAGLLANVQLDSWAHVAR